MLWFARDRGLDGTRHPRRSAGHTPWRRSADSTDQSARSTRRPGAGPQRRREGRDRPQIAARLDLDYEGWSRSRVLTLMRPDEVRRLSRRGPRRAAAHALAPNAGGSRASSSPTSSRTGTRIEAMTGNRPTHLCYPSGMYRMALPARAAREGVASATTCDPGTGRSAGSEPLLLPRFIDTTFITRASSKPGSPASPRACRGARGARTGSRTERRKLERRRLDFEVKSGGGRSKRGSFGGVHVPLTADLSLPICERPKAEANFT